MQPADALHSTTPDTTFAQTRSSARYPARLRGASRYPHLPPDCSTLLGHLLDHQVTLLCAPMPVTHTSRHNLIAGITDPIVGHQIQRTHSPFTDLNPTSIPLVRILDTSNPYSRLQASRGHSLPTTCPLDRTSQHSAHPLEVAEQNWVTRPLGGQQLHWQLPWCSNPRPD